MECIHPSARGKDMLAEAVEELARLQALVNQWRSARRGVEAEVLMRELDRGGFNSVLLNRQLSVLRGVPSEGRREDTPTNVDPEPLIEKAQAEIIAVDLFI
jgi:hypothetical protein